MTILYSVDGKPSRVIVDCSSYHDAVDFYFTYIHKVGYSLRQIFQSNHYYSY